MKKFAPFLALSGALAILSFGPGAVAEDPKPGADDLFDNTQYGVKVWKPKGKQQWKVVGEGAWDNWFKDTNGVVFMLAKWQSDNLEGNPQKTPPLVRMYAFRYDTQGKFKIGDWEGSPSSTKGFAKALFEELTTNDYKNLKNVKETAKLALPCGNFYEFSCYGEHKKYGGSHYVRVMVGKKDSKDTLQIVIASAPGEEKPEKSGVEIDQVLRSIKFYDPPKR